MQSLRIKAAQTLQSILENKIFFGELKKQFSEKDLPFINMLILTTLRHYTMLQAVTNSFLRKKIPHKHRIAEYLLILSVSELLFMKTAPYAVIDDTVNNIRQTTDRFLGGLANAILRKIPSRKENLLKNFEKINPLPADFLPVLDGYTEHEKKQIAQSIFCPPPLDLTVKKNAKEWANKLNADLLPNGTIRLFDAPKVQQIEGFSSGDWWIQDAAASLPVQILGNDLRGLKVADLCAAPGGKTAQLAARGAEVTAVDISADRLKTLQENMHRLGFDNIKTLAVDALDFLNNSPEAFFDIVLLDAPCSATGTFRRHPEILHIKNRQDVVQQAALQKQLLDKCHRILKSDGILVYSTCSIAKAEGELQISDFLREHKNFRRIPVASEEISVFGSWPDNLITTDGAIRTLPFFASEKNGMDAFFICKLKRII
ncbi:MAG: RsmB/NOP family class I SAM-dependent RNA methyltransferase [Pseudomonadota bacterium]|nr:RsmB/NOP family class I SAM-dependent RNA methyltransferase [Pseudomonadota bacterium]